MELSKKGGGEEKKRKKDNTLDYKKYNNAS